MLSLAVDNGLGTLSRPIMGCVCIILAPLRPIRTRSRPFPSLGFEPLKIPRAFPSFKIGLALPREALRLEALVEMSGS